MTIILSVLLIACNNNEKKDMSTEDYRYPIKEDIDKLKEDIKLKES